MGGRDEEGTRTPKREVESRKAHNSDNDDGRNEGRLRARGIEMWQNGIAVRLWTDGNQIHMESEKGREKKKVGFLHAIENEREHR